MDNESKDFSGTAYSIKYLGAKGIETLEVSGAKIHYEGQVEKYLNTKPGGCGRFEVIGRDVFFTREEAVAAAHRKIFSLIKAIDKKKNKLLKLNETIRMVPT